MFDLKRFLVENKLTKASTLNEASEDLDSYFMQLFPQCEAICKKQGITKDSELVATALWKALKIIRKNKDANYKPSPETYKRWNWFKFVVKYNPRVDASQENPFTANGVRKENAKNSGEEGARADVIRSLRKK